MSLYPLKFRPRFVEKVWGGRKLESALGKALPPGRQIGESWELYDFPPGLVDGSGEWVSSEIADGPLAGRNLHWAAGEFGRDLYGDVPLCGRQGQFPILVKFLDAHERASVQVCSGKGKTWYVVRGEANDRIYKGLAAGVARPQLEQAIDEGQVEKCLRPCRARSGDCFYLPGGVVHAMGAEILVAEVRTPDELTFDLLDSREAHEALAHVDFTGQADVPQRRSHVASYFTTVTRLATSPAYKVEKVRFTEGVEEAIPYDEPVVWIMLQGRAEIKVAGVSETTSLKAGDTVLLPAVMNRPVIKTLTDCVWLEVTFPTRPDVQ